MKNLNHMHENQDLNDSGIVLRQNSSFYSQDNHDEYHP